MDLTHVRKDYADRGMDRGDLLDDPFHQFEKWYQDACDNQLLEPNAMSLATCTVAARPSLRTVLLKFFDQRGFVFFTNLESRKASELKENPRVSALFPWIALERQVIICGTVTPVSTAESLAYFMKRPFGSQTAAWASPQSQVLTSRQMLEMKWEEMKRKYREGEVPLPSFWGGFRIVPEEVEFWQGRTSRLHDRFRYRRSTPDGAWVVERLAP
ncbi:MAG: pyridoxamine 5'-phosphate oxidase [Verrucomicrobiales bacterium]|nr:pyridoxamine 5'-phosphate oxidase [Verrucomicrobiales bacterium]